MLRGGALYRNVQLYRYPIVPVRPSPGTTKLCLKFPSLVRNDHLLVALPVLSCSLQMQSVLTIVRSSADVMNPVNQKLAK